MNSKVIVACFALRIAYLGLGCLGLCWVGLSGCIQPITPITPIIKHSGESYVCDAIYVPKGEKCIFVENGQVVVYEKGNSTPVAKSEPLANWFQNGYRYGYHSEQLGLLFLGKDQGVDCLDLDTLAISDRGPKAVGSFFCYPIPETSSFVTFLDEYNVARINQKNAEVEWQAKTRFDSVNCVHAISSSWIALGESEGLAGRVKLYNLRNGETTDAVLEHAKRVRGISISQDEKLVASSGDDGFLRVCELESREVIWEQKNDIDGAFAISIHPNNDYLAVGCMRGIKIWSLSERKLISSWNGHSWFVNCLSFSQDGELLLSGSPDKTGAMWRTSDLIGKLEYVKPF